MLKYIQLKIWEDLGRNIMDEKTRKKAKRNRVVFKYLAILELATALATFILGCNNAAGISNSKLKKEELKNNLADKLANVQAEDGYLEYLQDELKKLHVDLNDGNITAGEFNNKVNSLATADNIIEFAKTLNNGAVKADINKYEGDIANLDKEKTDDRRARNWHFGASAVHAGVGAYSLWATKVLKKDLEEDEPQETEEELEQ